MTYSKYVRILLLCFACLAIGVSQPATPKAGKLYTSAGFPPANRLWTSVDFSTAASLLEKKKVPLPKYSTSDGSELIDRITSLHNFDLLQNSTLELQFRMDEIGRTIKAINIIYKLYLEDSKVDPCFQERSQLIILKIFCACIATKIIEEHEKNLPSDYFIEFPIELQTNIRKAYFDALYSGRLKDFALGEMVITNNVFPSQQQTSAILKAMAGAVDCIKPHLKDSDRQEFIRKFINIKQEATVPEDLQTINSILDHLQPCPESHT